MGARLEGTKMIVVGAEGAERNGTELVGRSGDPGAGGHSAMAVGDATTLATEDASVETDCDTTSSQAAGVEEEGAGTSEVVGTSMEDSSTVVGSSTTVGALDSVGSVDAVDWGARVELSASSWTVEVVGTGGGDGNDPASDSTTLEEMGESSAEVSLLLCEEV
jgi:hypothetical protein